MTVPGVKVAPLLADGTVLKTVTESDVPAMEAEDGAFWLDTRDKPTEAIQHGAGAMGRGIGNEAGATGCGNWRRVSGGRRGAHSRHGPLRNWMMCVCWKKLRTMRYR